MRKSEVSFFKDLLENRKSQIMKNIRATQKEFEDLTDSEINDEIDMASISINQEMKQISTKQQEIELSEINSALVKLSIKKYGWCELCKDEINFQRLKALPYAKLCIKCQENKENKKDSINFNRKI